MNTDFNIKINGEHPNSYGTNVSIVDERAAAIVLEVNVDDISLDNELGINLAIDRMNNGNYDYRLLGSAVLFDEYMKDSCS